MLFGQFALAASLLFGDGGFGLEEAIGRIEAEFLSLKEY